MAASLTASGLQGAKVGLWTASGAGRVPAAAAAFLCCRLLMYCAGSICRVMSKLRDPSQVFERAEPSPHCCQKFNLGPIYNLDLSFQTFSKKLEESTFCLSTIGRQRKGVGGYVSHLRGRLRLREVLGEQVDLPVVSPHGFLGLNPHMLGHSGPVTEPIHIYCLQQQELFVRLWAAESGSGS